MSHVDALRTWLHHSSKAMTCMGIFNYSLCIYFHQVYRSVMCICYFPPRNKDHHGKNIGIIVYYINNNIVSRPYAYLYSEYSTAKDQNIENANSTQDIYLLRMLKEPYLKVNSSSFPLLTQFLALNWYMIMSVRYSHQYSNL